MSISEFHSKLTSGEGSSLFAALRRLSSLDDPRRMIAQATAEESAAGWPRWDGDHAGAARSLAAQPA
jgi:hypothetical protein